MTTKKKATTVSKVRASVGQVRRLALATRALLDALDGAAISEENRTPVVNAETEAKAVLESLGFGSLVGIPKQIAALEAQLSTAVTEHDYPAIASLGQQLERVKLGKSPKPGPAVKGKPSRKNGQVVTAPNIEVKTENAGNASETTTGGS